MKLQSATLAAVLAVMGGVCAAAGGQTTGAAVNTAQQVSLLGLLSSNHEGSFPGAAYAADGTVYLLLNEGDGLRVLHVDAGLSTVLGSVHLGAAGDVPVALAVAPGGQVFATGTTTSGTLVGSSGTAFPSVADSSTNSFLAAFDGQLNPLYLTFLGAGRTAVTAAAATADSVFVTGITFSAAFPVSAAGIEQSPATGSSENGFVERFVAATGALSYATYLTGVNGNTMPAGVVADGSDAAYIAGTTSSSGYPTVAALQGEILGGTSGFLTKLSATGSALTFSTFVAGGGISGLALDAKTPSLLLTGSVAAGQFPLGTVAMPMTAASYQTLLRVSVDGQTLLQSVLLAAGSSSEVGAAPDGSAWVTGSVMNGSVAAPLFPGLTQPDDASGDSYVLHVTSAGAIDQTVRVGGRPKSANSYATLTSALAAPAVSATGGVVLLPGQISAQVSASLAGTERFDLPLVAAPSTLLPNTLRDVVPSSCTSSVCSGTAAVLGELSVTAGAALGVAADDALNVIVRDLGSTPVQGLVVTATGFTTATNCGSTLSPSTQCSVAVSGTGPGSVQVSATNATAAGVTEAATTATADPLGLSAAEVDLGIVSAASGPATETVTVSNLTGSAQSFSVSRDGGATTAASFALNGGDCTPTNASGSYTVGGQAVCHLQAVFTPSSSAANDGPVATAFKVGTRDVLLTAYSQAAALHLSATELDFGTVVAGGGALPRWLYLSNNSTAAIAHTTAGLGAASAFRAVDNCPPELPAHSVCSIAVSYAAGSGASDDADTLLVDGQSVALTGTTESAAATSGFAANPSLTVSASALNFATAVLVTGVSGGTQTVTLTNSGTSTLPLGLAIGGDFSEVTSCGSQLTPGSNCTVLVSFTPSYPGPREGVLSITTGSGFTPTVVSLSGTGAALLPANDGTLSLGQTLAGEPVFAWYPVQQPVTTLTASSTGAGFAVALVNSSTTPSEPPLAFASSATVGCTSCWLGVEFLAQTAGSATGTVQLSSVATGKPYLLSLTATALPVSGVLLTPGSPSFGAVAVNSSSATLPFTLTNAVSPGAQITVQSVSTTGDFAASSGQPLCSGVLSATASCALGVSFSPTATGARTGTLTVVTSAGTATAALSGYGLADPGVALSPNELDFNPAAGSSGTQQTITVTNTSGGTEVIGSPAVSSGGFGVSSGCSTLAAGGSCTLTVNYTPGVAQSAATLSLPYSLTVNGQSLSGSVTAALNGNYTTQNAGLLLTPAEMNFGPLTTGTVGPTRAFTLTNVTAATLNITLQMPRQFALAAPANCATLAAGASCSFSVEAVAVTSGSITGTVFASGISADGLTSAQALNYMLGYGSGAGTLKVVSNAIPGSGLSFGNVTSGQSSVQTVTLTNAGTSGLTIRRITSEPPFLAVNNCGGTLAASASCTVTVSYAPIDEIATGSTATLRSDVGELIVESDAASSPDVLALGGSAQAVTSSSPGSSAVLAAYSLSESALTFANTQVGSVTAAQTVVVTNQGTTTLHFSPPTLPTDFTAVSSCGTVLPGGTCTLAVSFAPGNASSATVRSGTVELNSDAADTLEFLTLLGSSSAAPLALGPTTVNFGTVSLGTPASTTVTITNSSGSPITLTGISASNGFSVGTGTCPVNGAPLAAGVTCTVTVTVTPTSAGSLSGTLSVSSSATTQPLTASLSATVVAGALQITPGSLSFGSILEGSSSSLTLNVVNNGTAAVSNIAGAISGANAAEFQQTGPCATLLAPAQSCTVTVSFAPTALGAAAATLTITSTDPNSPATIPLSGTGAAAGSFQLTVNGGSAQTITVASGSPAVYNLLLTPVNGFTGPVALTCSPVSAAEYASCSLLASQITLSGAAQPATATVNTLTKSAVLAGLGSGWALLLAPALLLLGARGGRRRALRVLAAAVLCVGALQLAACGSKGAASSSTSNNGVLLTPAGSYSYQVTASSTSGPSITSSVTLNLVVQ